MEEREINKSHSSFAEMIKNLELTRNEDNKTLQHVLEHPGGTADMRRSDSASSTKLGLIFSVLLTPIYMTDQQLIKHTSAINYLFFYNLIS